MNRGNFLLEQHNYKVDIATTILLMKELHFHTFKKLSKENYQAVFESGFVKTHYYIEFFFQADLTLEKLKLSYADFIATQSKRKDIKLLLISLNPINKPLSELANSLDITISTFQDVCRALMNVETLEQMLTYIEKGQGHYYTPTISLKTMKLPFNHFVSTLTMKGRKEIMILEGDYGAGKTSLLKYIQTYLLKDYLNTEHTNIFMFPIFLDASQYSKYSDFKDFVLNEGFVKRGIIVKSQKGLDILMKLNHFIFLVDNLDVLHKDSPIFVINFINTIIKAHKKNNYSFLWVVNKYFFHFMHRQKKHIKYFFKPYFRKADFLFYQLENFNLLDIKYQVKSPKLKQIIEKKPYLRQIANYSYLISMLGELPLERVEEIESVETFFVQLLSHWETNYLSDMGKEVLLENIAMQIITKEIFSLDNVPDYIENFINIEFKDEPFNLTLLKQDMDNTLILKKVSDNHYRFANPFCSFYFISKRVKEETQKGYFEHLHYFSHPMVFSFIKNQFSKEKMLDIFKEYVESSVDGFEKGKKFALYYQVLKYMLGNDSPIFIKGISFSQMKIDFESLPNLYFKDEILENIEIYNCDTSYLEGVQLNIKSSDLSYSNYTGSKLEDVKWDQTLCKQAIWNKSVFDKVNFENVNLLQSFFNDAKFKNSHIKYSSLHGVIAVNATFLHTDISYTDISNIDLYKAEFIKSSLEECKAISSSFAYTVFEAGNISNIDFILSIFDKAQFRSSQLTNIQFNNCNMFGVEFKNSELTNISFKMADLRSTSFEGSKLTNVIFEGADLRGSDIWDSNAILCPVSKASLERSIKTLA